MRGNRERPETAAKLREQGFAQLAARELDAAERTFALASVKDWPPPPPPPPLDDRSLPTKKPGRWDLARTEPDDDDQCPPLQPPPKPERWDLGG